MSPLANIDLRLLECLDALIRERSVTLAAERLQMSQGNMSNSLGRLRKLLHDPLLVRTARGMKLTDRALELRDQTQELIRGLRALLDTDENRDIATVRRSMKIACVDAAALFALGPLLEDIRQIAPNLRLEISQTPNLGVAEPLGDGTIDLVIGAYIELSDALHIARLVSGKMVCVVGADGRFAASGVDLDDYCNAAHAVCTVSQGLRATAEIHTDQALADMGRSRQVRLASQFMTVITDAVARSDLIATMPDFMVRHFSANLPLAGKPLPFVVPEFSLSAVWHPRTKGDWVLAWFRQQLRQHVERNIGMAS
ncbi:MAG: LysR family transcriptional regulator [Rhodanobacter sp.]